jgi:hypothetical protein
MTSIAGGTALRRVLIESVAVVASILLAFSIDAWWDQRGDDRDARESRVVVAADLESSIEHLTWYSDYVDQITDASLGAYQALSRPVPASSRDSVADLLILSTVRRTMNVSRAGYDELVSTGGLRLVRDRSLRDELVRFYGQVDILSEVAEANFTNYTDGYLMEILVGGGLLLRRPIREGTLDTGLTDAAVRERLGVEFQHRPDPLWEFSPDSREWDRVRSALLQNGRGTQTAATVARQLLAAATDLRQSIEEYLDGGAR